MKIKCKCGKLLVVPPGLEGKKIVCPACRTAYRVPGGAKPGAKPSASVKSATSGRANAEAPSQLELPSIDPASTPSELNLLEGIELAPAGPICPKCSKPQPTGAVICVACGIELVTGRSILDKGATPPAQSAAYAGARRGVAGRAHLDAIQGPARGYWADAFGSFVYPIRPAANLVTFGIVSIAATLAVGLGYLGCFGLVGLLIVHGWLTALYFNVVQETATGSEELPGIRMQDGFIEDIIKPALKYVGAIAFAMFPAILFVILTVSGVLPDYFKEPIIPLIWLAAGIFIWPIIVILFAFNALNMLLRIDLMITTVFRTFAAYMILWLMLLLVGLMSMSSELGPLLGRAGIKFVVLKDPSWGIAGDIFFSVLNTYLSIVAMRQIGMYYLHFKKRFTLQFE